MKTKHGFTLIELLAVIVVLGLVLVVAGSLVLNSKKRANLEEVKNVEKTLSDLGTGIYSYEFISGDRNSDKAFYNLYKQNAPFIITLDELKSAGYLKDLTDGNKVKNPFGGDGCDAYILVTPNEDNPEFKGFINCGKNNYCTNDCTNWNDPDSFSKKANLTISN